MQSLKKTCFCSCLHRVVWPLVRALKLRQFEKWQCCPNYCQADTTVKSGQNLAWIKIPWLQKWFGQYFLPANIPTADPIAACKQISGEEMSRATRKMPPVQGFPQPYTWPTPTGMDCKSCSRGQKRACYCLSVPWGTQQVFCPSCWLKREGRNPGSELDSE